MVRIKTGSYGFFITLFNLFLVGTLLFSLFYPIGDLRSSSSDFGPVIISSGKYKVISPNFDDIDICDSVIDFSEDVREISLDFSDLIIEYDPFLETEIISRICCYGGFIKRIYKFHNQMAIYFPLQNKSNFEMIHGIKNIWKDRIFKGMLNESVPLIKPPAEWGAIENFFSQSINGTGIKIAVLDTGIDGTHWDLYPRVILNQSYVVGEGWQDENGHGTHVAGIIAGNGNRSLGKFIGLAPCAYLLNFKVLNKFNRGFESDILSAIEDAIANGSDIINLSLKTEDSGSGIDPLSMKVEWAIDQGSICVVAAGSNEGYYNISRPGVAPSAITVGATDKSDNMYIYSPYGPTRSPSFTLKPEILAPGFRIVSCSSSFGGPYGEPVSIFYHVSSGTSMSTAHVTGAIALILQVFPSWDQEMVKDALMGNAIDLGLSPYIQGGGRIFIPPSINSSVLISGVLDFGLVTNGFNKTSMLKLRNLK